MFLIPLQVVGMRGGEGFDCMDVSHSFTGSRDEGGSGLTVWMFLIPLRVVGMGG